MALTTDVFLSHDWGKDHLNHLRVRLIDQKLQELGYKTWFDEKDMKGEIHKAMAGGIEHTKCVIVFITKNYYAKVTGMNGNDNCKLEFDYAASKKTKSNMIAVVMESDMCDTRKWTGSVGIHLCNKIYIDMSGDLNDQTYLREKINQLKKELENMGIQPMNSPIRENISSQQLPGIFNFIFHSSKTKLLFLVNKMF